MTDEVDYLTADEEENYIIAQANDLFDPETREFGYRRRRRRVPQAGPRAVPHQERRRRLWRAGRSGRPCR